MTADSDLLFVALTEFQREYLRLLAAAVFSPSTSRLRDSAPGSGVNRPPVGSGKGVSPMDARGRPG